MAKSMNTFNEGTLVRGSLIVLRRRCGKPVCRCAQGKPHETPALSYSLNGTTRILTLRKKDVKKVKAALARYKKAKALLDKQALAGISTFCKRIAKEKAQLKEKRR